MADTGHQSRQHSKLGPSAAHRWLECPGSVLGSANAENKSSFFALEGTAAHEFLEFVLRTGCDPRDYEEGYIALDGATPETKFVKVTPNDFKVDNENSFEITDEMCEAMEVTIAVVKKYYDPAAGDILMLETRLDMSWIHPKLFGTGDILIYKKAERRLIVLDFKYGVGIAVEVGDNPQVLTYAVGGERLLVDMGHKVDIVTCVIVQPRCFHPDGPVRDEDVDALDLQFFAGFLKEKAAETDDPNARLHAGEHCYFCPIAHSCATLRKYVIEMTGANHDKELTEADMLDPSDMTMEQLGKVVREGRIMEGWIKRVRSYAHAEAMEGRVADGCKVVDKRAYRKWSVSAYDVEVICDLLDIDRTDYMYPEKLRSPNQIEKATGKKGFTAAFSGLWKKESTGFVLAPIEDRREAVKVDKSEAFGAVEED